MKAIIGNIIASGTTLGRRAIIYDGGSITDIVRPKDVNLEKGNILDFGEHYVSAGFIDLHFNGAGDQIYQFCNNEGDANRVFAALASVGTVYGLPVISATDIEEYRKVRDFARDYKRSNAQFLGLNFEGPFISPKKPGFGKPECVGEAVVKYADVYYDLLDDMKVIMTIAPEVISKKDSLQMITDGVILSFGHSDADAALCRDFVDFGVRYSTHLFNGMPPIAGRAPSLAGVCLSSPSVTVSVILDGHHLASETVKLVWAIKEPKEICVITDGMPPLGGSAKSFMYRNEKIEVKENGALLDQNGALSGTRCSQLEMCRLLLETTGARLDEVVDTVTRAPACVLGMERTIGDIRVGMTSSFTVFTDDFQSVATILEGELLTREQGR